MQLLAVLAKVTLLAGLTTPLAAGVPDWNQPLNTAGVTVQVAWASVGSFGALAEVIATVAPPASSTPQTLFNSSPVRLAFRLVSVDPFTAFLPRFRRAAARTLRFTAEALADADV